MKINYLNRTIMPPEKYEDETELDEQAFINYVRERYKPNDLFDLYEHDKEIAIKFAEWVDTKAVRNGFHEWTIGAGNEKKHFTSQELFDFYCSQL